MSSSYFGAQAGELADTESQRLRPLMPPGVDAGFCGDGWHDCKGFCGNCGIHLHEHGTKCGEYAETDGATGE